MPAIAQASGLFLPFQTGYFHSVITSPPYYTLREYHGEQVVDWQKQTYQPMVGSNHLIEYPKWSGPLGGEPTSEMYIGHMLSICDEIERVLRDDGVFWLNISDTYSGSGGAGGDYNVGGTRQGQPKYRGRKESGLQNGDMMGVPWRLAFALQARGWILRRDVIWAKQPMPEPRMGWRFQDKSCDCAKERREAHISAQMEEQGVARHRVYDKAGTKFLPNPDCPKCKGTGFHSPTSFKKESWRHTASHEYVFMLTKKMGYYADHYAARMELSANPLDVVRPPRENYSGKHFAVFPPSLVAPLIAATVPRFICATCAKPLAPVVESHIDTITNRRNDRIVDYRNVCIHAKEHLPGRVLDPFFGSGTVGMVAKMLEREFAGTDISREYLSKQALKRAIGEIPKSQQKYDDLPLFASSGEDSK
jgi:DNA modification methylase